MPELPKGLTARKRQADGKTEIVGTNATGSEYVARVCEQDGVTERDCHLLDIGSPEKRDIDKFIGFYRDERDGARRDWERSMDNEYMEGASEVVHAGLHLKESTIGYSRAYAQNWEKVFGN